MVLAVAIQDGRTLKVRVIRATTGGKSADAAGMSQIEHQYEHPAPGDSFHRPFDPLYANEYTFQQVDPSTYRFASSVRDGAHGTGTLSLDAAGNVVKYQYTPNVLPRYTSSGTIVGERSQVLPNFWWLTREAHAYSGHYAIFGGGATVIITYDSFSRYPDLASVLTGLTTVCPQAALC